MQLKNLLRACAITAATVYSCAPADAGELEIKGKILFEALDAKGNPSNKPGFASTVSVEGPGVPKKSVVTNGAGAFVLKAVCGGGAATEVELRVDGELIGKLKITAAECANGVEIGLNDIVVRRCPCVPGPFPKPEVQIYVLKDPVNKNEFGLNCTNQAATGDFVRTFRDVAGGGKVKAIGKCHFIGGRNRATPLTMPGAKKIVAYVHTNTDDKTIDNANCQQIKWYFDVAKCELLRLRLKRVVVSVGGVDVVHYDEVAPRKVIKKADFAGFANFKANVKELVKDVFAAAGASPATEGADADGDGGGCGPSIGAERLNRRPCEGIIRWATGGMSMNFDPGDRIIIDDLSAAELIELDPRFDAADSTDGLVLTSNADFVPVDDDILLSFDQKTDVMPRSSGYVIEDASAAPFWELVLAGEPIMGFDPENAPDSAAAMGVLDLFGSGLLGDVSADGHVNSEDLNMVLADFGCVDDLVGCVGDADGDGRCDTFDLNIVLAHWNDSCEAEVAD